jgi:hypothetical protein
MRRFRPGFLGCLLLLTSWVMLRAQGHLADGFKRLPDGATVAVMPIDVELFTVTAGGVYEPQAEWTAQASKNLKEAILERPLPGKGHFQELPGEVDASLAELTRLHKAVARAIIIHHVGKLRLPSKQGKLDWSMGEETGVIRKRLEADYALYVFLRDSYASAGRKATMVLWGAFGVGLPGGAQVGYATLVDTRTGQVVWFNQMVNMTGDVRDPGPARKTLENLLSGFPG